MPEQFDTSRGPRAVLNVMDAEEWLEQVTTLVDQYGSVGAAPPEKHFPSPMANMLEIGSTWAPNIPGLGTEAFNTSVEQVQMLVVAAREMGVLDLPTGVDVEFAEVSNGEYVWQVTGNRYAGLTLSSGRGTITWLGNVGAVGVEQCLAILADAVSEANKILSSLAVAAATVLADYSTDPLLLTRLADYDDPMVRNIALQNPAAPEEAHILAALRDNR